MGVVLTADRPSDGTPELAATGQTMASAGAYLWQGCALMAMSGPSGLQ